MAPTSLFAILKALLWLQVSKWKQHAHSFLICSIPYDYSPCLFINLNFYYSNYSLIYANPYTYKWLKSTIVISLHLSPWNFLIIHKHTPQHACCFQILVDFSNIIYYYIYVCVSISSHVYLMSLSSLILFFSVGDKLWRGQIKRVRLSLTFQSDIIGSIMWRKKLIFYILIAPQKSQYQP